MERQQLLGEFRLKPLLAGLEIAAAGFHAFRHASATILSRMNVPMEIRRARMGHTDEEMTPRYTHVIEKDAREVAATSISSFCPMVRAADCRKDEAMCLGAA